MSSIVEAGGWLVVWSFFCLVLLLWLFVRVLATLTVGFLVGRSLRHGLHCHCGRQEQTDSDVHNDVRRLVHRLHSVSGNRRISGRKHRYETRFLRVVCPVCFGLFLTFLHQEPTGKLPSGGAECRLFIQETREESKVVELFSFFCSLDVCTNDL